MNDSKTYFQKYNYCLVKNAISTELRDFVTQYALFDEMQNFTPELEHEQVPNAHSRYGDAAMEAMLLYLHKTMEENTGLTLFPTYSYYRIYRNGDKLDKHTDRESCEISATLCFNYSYDDKDVCWPIFMDNKPVNLKPGDMVIYKGCELLHWREPMSCKEDDWQVQGFFHFVDANGPYSHFKYDKRECIGQATRQNKFSNISVKSYILFTK
jgi:hypothetical protein